MGMCLLVASWGAGLSLPPSSVWISETDDPINAPQVFERIYYSHNEAFWGEQGRVPSRPENGLKESGGATVPFRCACWGGGLWKGPIEGPKHVWLGHPTGAKREHPQLS